ncbi:hypothetical protein [Bradyrhizobium sp. cf659]|uniref:hypothetical protein n=1 Tax=Bradyrhizobium sp. cf659 TaxID=1761771 RepID=UPI001160758A|nr:hypothetical protein [Bradyrhizobium sp. cf659]
MKVNARQLMADASGLLEIRKVRDLRRRTGATEIITAALSTIEHLRAENVPWEVIAAALAKQGAVQCADRKPLTGRRLCALLSAIRKREARRARKRRVGADLVPKRDGQVTTIAPELATKSRQPATTFSESAFRAEAYANLQPLLKGQTR